MKKTFFAFLFFLFPAFIFAQSVGINTTTPNPSAILDVKSNNKGVLFPRTSTISRNAISNPAKGLLVYDTTTSGFWFHNGTAWSQLSGAGNGWNLTGNAGTNPATNFIGTTDNQPLRFRVNNVWAGEVNPTNNNVFFGLDAGNAGTTGNQNTAYGSSAFYANTKGNSNTAIGYQALFSNTTGNSNTASGRGSLYENTMGLSNTANGYQALFNNTTGSGNTASGANALVSNIDGSNNTSNGISALYSNTSGSDNTASGQSALYSNTTGTSNTANGSEALLSNTTGNSNTANGYQSLYNNTTGSSNTANGRSALYSNTTGIDNTANGSAALYSNTTGEGNSANGREALYSNTSGFYNTANGIGSLYSNITGSSNTANGNGSLYTNTTGGANTSNGYLALYSNTTGGNNTGIGSLALTDNTTGTGNTAVGTAALSNNITGSYNTAVGYGSGTGGPNAAGLFNTVGIGNDGGFLNGQSNQAIIGNASMIFIGGKVPWGVISDERVKNNIVEDVVGLNFIMKLRPVTYHISTDAIITVSNNKKTADFPSKYDGDKIKYTGFLAQEVEKAAKAANYDFSGFSSPKTPSGLYTLSYEQFVVPLVKAMQEQQTIITSQQKQIDLLEKRLTALEAK